MDEILTRTFEKLKKDAGRSRATQVMRASCVSTASLLSKGQQDRADDYIEPLTLACSSRNAKLVVTALDCFQKLIAHGYLRGSARNIPSADGDPGADKGDKKRKSKKGVSPPPLAEEEVLKTIEKKPLAIDPAPKPIKTEERETEESQEAAASEQEEISKSDELSNEDEQVDNPIRSGEKVEGEKSEENMNVHETNEDKAESIASPEEEGDQAEDTEQNADQGETTVEEENANKESNEDVTTCAVEAQTNQEEEEEENAASDIGESAVVVWSTLETVVELICKCKDVPNDDVQLYVVKVLLTLMTTSTVELHEAALMIAVQACYHIHLTSKNQVNKSTASNALDQIVRIVFQRMEAVDLREGKGADETTEKAKTVSSEPKSFDTVLHKDAFLLFRALCKLSMRSELSSESNDTGVALQSKMVALSAVLSVLDKCGPSFRGSEKFVFAIRQYLCVSLLKNCTSLLPSVIDISLKIFVKLISYFKDHLKAEIEVFIDKVFLPILDSENSSGEHKTLVLEVFHSICQDPQALVEIFLNYDCNVENKDLFRRIILTLAKVAKGGKLGNADSHSNRKGEDIRATLQLKGLQALVSTTHSLTVSSCINEASSSSTSTSLATSIDPLRPMLVKRNTQSASKLESEAGHAPTEDGDVKDVDRGEGEAIRPRRGSHEAEGSDSVVLAKDREEDVRDSSVARAGGGGGGQAVGNAAVEKFAFKKKQQEQLEDGVLKFNLNPKKGILYLSDVGHLKKPLDAKNVAKFLHVYQDKLDKTAIGDFLGKEKEYMEGFCVKVLHEYVDSMDFTNLPLDESIRHYLSGFRLPGEAQKIDRMMEKFSERFCVQNATVFPSPDTAFVLSFSIIMLNTDLHNPAIADDRRMTKQGFRRQAEGIANGENLEEEYLDAIYDRIKTNPISLKEDDQLRGPAAPVGGGIADLFSSAATVAGRRKLEAYSKEREDIVRESQLMFSQVKKSRAQRIEYISMADLTDEHVRPMFEVAWGPILGVYVHLLDQVDEYSIISLCLEGLRDCVRIAAVFDIPLVRDTMVNTLTKFTTLDTVREMQPKNIECIKHLLHLAIVDGDYLGDSWFAVLDSISQLGRLQLLSTGLTDDSFFNNVGESMSSPSPNKRRNKSFGGDMSSPHQGGGGGGHSGEKRHTTMSGVAKFFYGPTRAEASRQVEESNAEMVNEAIESSKVDYVFSSSTRLSSSAIQDFVKALCLVSLKELQVQVGSGVGGLSPSSNQGRASLPQAFSTFRMKDRDSDMAQPRIFSLQKLVEVADCNMPVRGRIIWANIWRLLATHFTTVACGEEGGYKPNTAVSLYAVDSLRQLSLKFLSKDEMAGFNFQRMFLEPFAVIMQQNSSTEVREMVLSSLNSLLLARAPNVRSGWRPIFAVFAIAGSLRDSECEQLSQQAYNSVHRLVQSHFGLLVNDFPELISCLLAFGRGPYTEMALGALNLIHHCAAYLSTPDLVPSEGLANSNLLTRSSSAASDSQSALYTPTVRSKNSLKKKSSKISDQALSMVDNFSNSHGSSSYIESVSSVLPDEVQVYPLLPLWWCILAGLSSLISDDRLTVRSTALAQFEDILHHYGRRFSSRVWDGILRGIVFPTISNAIDSDSSVQPISNYPAERSLGVLSAALSARKQGSMDSWVATSAKPTLSCIVKLFLEHLIPSTDIRPPSSGSTKEAGDDSGSEVVIVNKEDINDSVENLIHVLPLLLSFLQAIITNRHSEKGSPQSAELLARIGMSVLEELVDGLSSLNCGNIDQSEPSNFSNSSVLIWSHVTQCLCSINEFAISMDAFKQSEVAEEITEEVIPKSSPRKTSNKKKSSVQNDEDSEKEEEEEEREEEREEEGDVTIDDDEDDENKAKSTKPKKVFTMSDDMMTKLVLALKVAKMMRELLDVEGIEGVGSYKKLSLPSSKSRSVSPKDRLNALAAGGKGASNSPIDTTKKLLNNGMSGSKASSSSTDSSTDNSSADMGQRGRLSCAHTFEENGLLIMVGGQGRLTQDSIEKLLDGLYASANHAMKFNTNLELRLAIQRGGLMTMPHMKLVDSRGAAMQSASATRPLPHIFEQEVLSHQSLLACLLRILTGNDADSENKSSKTFDSLSSPKWARELAEPLLVKVASQILKRYDDAERALESAWFDGTNNDKILHLDHETRCLAPAAAHALRGILAFDDQSFIRHKDWFYPLVVALITSSSRTIRSLVQEILSGPTARLIVLSPS